MKLDEIDKMIGKLIGDIENVAFELSKIYDAVEGEVEKDLIETQGYKLDTIIKDLRVLKEWVKKGYVKTKKVE